MEEVGIVVIVPSVPELLEAISGLAVVFPRFMTQLSFCGCEDLGREQQTELWEDEVAVSRACLCIQELGILDRLAPTQMDLVGILGFLES